MIEKIRRVLLRILGVENRLLKDEEAIKTIFYYLNEFVIDPSKLPHTKDPDLRILQMCDVLLLAIIDKICKKHQLTYWLDYGTLLGAIRHKGFIPWDDDTDISMPREDYNRFMDIFRKEVNDEDFSVEYKDNCPLKSLGVGYCHQQTGIWCDIFPYDTYNCNCKIFEDAVLEIKQAESQWIQKYLKIKGLSTPQSLCDTKMQYFKSTNEGLQILTSGKEFPHNHPNAYYTIDEIYPLERVEFDGYVFNSPANPQNYLSKCISKHWKGLPLTGLFHHDEGRGALSSWAKRSGLDMYEVLQHLKNVYNSL